VAIPAGDLTKLRGFQHSRAYLVIQQPQYSTDGGVTWTGYDWSCRINGAHSDDVEEALTVDGGSAGVDLLDGQTVLVGSGYGEWDKAVCRVRGDQTVGPGTTSLNIGTSSEVRGNVADDDYVVVLDEHRFWQRYGRIEISGEDVVWYKDYDITWEDLAAGGDADRRIAMMRPVPIMGPHAVKFVEIGGSSAQFYFDWQDSYATAPAQNVTDWVSEGETDHAGGTWNSVAQTPGWQTVDDISGLRGFRVQLAVDDGYANATIEHFTRGIRYVFTLRRPGETQPGDPANAEPITEFEISSPVAGSFEQGYWRTSITVFESQASEYNIMPEALVVLFTEDTYDGTVGSVGPITDRENILLVGRIVDGTIRKNPETGDVTFDVASPGAEAALYHNYPIVIQNDDAAATWIDTPDLTVDRAVHYYTTWHTTLNSIADLYQTGDTIEIYAQDFLEGTMYATLNQFLQDRLFARLLCDKYGRFFCEIDAQEQPFGSVASLWTMQQSDWLDEVMVRQRIQAPVNAVDCGGLIYAAGEVTPKLSRAPGLFTKYRGARQESMSLAITSQNALNTTSGRHLNALNHEFEVDFQLAGNWRYCDIAPQRVVNVGTLVTDRATLTDNYIIRSVTNNLLPVEGVIFTDIQVEQEVNDGVAGVTIPIPDALPGPEYEPWEYPGFGFVEPLGLVPQEPPAPLSGPQFYTTQFSDTEDYWTDDITANPPVWNTLNHVAGKNKTALMYSSTTNRFFGYGYGIWEYSPLPFDTGAWASKYTEAAIATLFGHGADYNEVYVFRMQFSIRPDQEEWSWAGVWLWYSDGATEHVILGCLATRNAWDTIFYITEIFDLEESVDFTNVTGVGRECGLAVDMHSKTMYIGVAKEPEEDGVGTPTFDSWWRLYRSTDCGYSFHLAQSAGVNEWGTDGWDIASTGAEISFDIWVPWVSDPYAGGTVFWTVVLMDTANNAVEQEYPPMVYWSLNHGLSYTDIGNQGGLDSGLNFLGGPWNSAGRVFGGISTFNGADTEVPKLYTWVTGGAWSTFNDRTGNNHNDFNGWLVTEQSGFTLASGLVYSEPYFVEVGAETDKVCTEDDVFWQTWVET
jgi:hypothetical protein